MDAQIKMYKKELEEKINKCKSIEELEALSKTVPDENDTKKEEEKEEEK